MIVACHQPMFLPYLGYFYKMDHCDLFAYSDTVLYSKHAMLNYNYVNAGGVKQKLVVPVHAGSDMMIKDVRLCDWHHFGVKVFKTIQQLYSKCKYYKDIICVLQPVLQQDHKFLLDLNIALTEEIKRFLAINVETITESSLNLEPVEKNIDIINVCHSVGADVYLSGTGAMSYIDEKLFHKNDIAVQYSRSDFEKVSIIDYLCNNGWGKIDWEQK